jgi:cytochrome c oxidase cbb3-type subunit 3
MSEGERDRRLDHAVDGIEEFDNPLPGWWTWIFVLTIVFSVGYWIYYEIGPGPTVIAQYEAEMRGAERQAAATPAAAGVSEQMLRGLVADARATAAGKEIFATRCTPCHGPQGQGVIGPNLTDEYWMHGGTLLDIRRSVSDGIPEKGMIPWKDQLKPDELNAVVAYVATLRGTNPPNPKPAQGTGPKGEPAPSPPAASR